MAVAITTNTLVSARADRMESKENTRFIATIQAIACPTVRRAPTSPWPPRWSMDSMWRISLNAV